MSRPVEVGDLVTQPPNPWYPDTFKIWEVTEIQVERGRGNQDLICLKLVAARNSKFPIGWQDCRHRKDLELLDNPLLLLALAAQ